MNRVLGLVLVCATAPAVQAQGTQPTLGARLTPIIESSGKRFRDLNRNGTLDPYEDWRLAPDARARDLVSRMTLEEKAGAMMHGTARTAGWRGTWCARTSKDFSTGGAVWTPAAFQRS